MIIAIIFKIFLSVGFASWSDFEKKLYVERRFVELEHSLFLHKSKSARLISKQQEDLVGCKDIHEGIGGSLALLKCARFLNRENKLKLFSPHRKQLVGDLNILCSRFSERTAFLTKALKEKGLFNDPEWKKCHSALWKQVYLTVYEGFLSDPVRALKLAKQARVSMDPDGFWSLKISEMMK